MSADQQQIIIKAILGPTNTGKTHFAIERMLARSSGMIGLPLRLLAREVYDKICAIKGREQCALITGEEKIEPPHAKYYVSTVEAMPTQKSFAFVAIDEIQLIEHRERGHIFTDRLLHCRGQEETLFLGAETARFLIRDLVPHVQFETRDRFSSLSYGGVKKLTRLPKRSVIIAFSTDEVYAIAELIRRFRGGAAIVMGALSPRTRNAQASLYQSGEVDFLVATDAVGMGLNLDVDHVAFASLRKFDGEKMRQLTTMEVGQIAGRAGRFRNDGTFGTTADSLVLSEEMIKRVENHDYEPLHYAFWRHSGLCYDTADDLIDSLNQQSSQPRLRRVSKAVDELTLERFIIQKDIRNDLTTPSEVRHLWEICQIPDFRNITLDLHIRLMRDIYDELSCIGRKFSNEFLNSRISSLEMIEGTIDDLSRRLSKIRTWAFCVHKTHWTDDMEYWINRTREVEDALSDALHNKLAARFVDRRTSALINRLGRGNIMETRINDDGEVRVEDHKIGELKGLKFIPEQAASEIESKTLAESARQAVTPEVNRRLTSIAGAQHNIFTLSHQGEILWGGMAVGKIGPSGTVFNPDAVLIGGELGDNNLCLLAQNRMRDYLKSEVQLLLEPLIKLKEISQSQDPLISADLKGFTYLLLENHGYLDRYVHSQTVRALDPDTRKYLRDNEVVFGQYDVFMRSLVKPKPATLLGLLLAHGAGGDKRPFIPFAGVTSVPNEGEMSGQNFSKEAIARAGYKECGPRIIRVDMLNRLSGQIRQAQFEAGTRRFQIMQEMLALLGCSYEHMQGILKSLNYQVEVLEEGATSPTPEMNAPVSERLISSVKKRIRKSEMARLERQEAFKTQKEGRVEENVASEAEALPKNTPPDLSVSEADSHTMSEADASEPSKSGEVDIEEAPQSASSNQSASSKEAAIKSSRPKTEPLSIYNIREELEDGTVVFHPNREFWYLRFPQNRGSQRGGRSDSYSKKRDFKSPKSKPQYKARPTRPSKRQIEDSPFAALAALKANAVKKKDEKPE